MYIPNSNQFIDQNEVIEFMKRFSFATIITANNNLPIASHLPFIVNKDNNQIILISHFAKLNEQWKEIEKNTCLVIFTEPHAYISPKHYDKSQNVPTWNYISVHAYGIGRLVLENERITEILEHTIENYEKAYKQQWDILSDEYKTNLKKGIVVFEIVVNDIQAKKKLSQNRTNSEKEKIISSLASSSITNEQMIAHYMNKEIIH